jgi:hypothetical protein
MANASIDIYLATAALSRATWAIATKGEVGAAADLDHVRVFVPMAMRRARRQVRGLERNQDARLKALAERALESGALTVPVPIDG